MIVNNIQNIRHNRNINLISAQKRNVSNNSNTSMRNANSSHMLPKYLSPAHFGINFTSDDFGKPLVWAWDEGSVSYHLFANSSKLNLLGGDEEHLRKMAKILWAQSDYDLKEHWTIRKVPIIGIVKKEKSQQAYDRIMPYIREVRKEVEDLTKIQTDLQYKKLTGIADLSKQQTHIAKLFNNMFTCDKNGGAGYDSPFYVNGILICGNGEINKDIMYNWLLEENKFKRVDVYYDSSSPSKSLQALRKAAYDAKAVYEGTGIRTFIELRGFEELIKKTDENSQSPEDRERRRFCAVFKNLAEVMASRYYATLLMRTNEDIRTFDRSVIGSQRFTSTLKLDREELTPEEEQQLESVTEQLREFQAQAAQAKNYTFFSSVDYDEVRKYD